MNIVEALGGEYWFGVYAGIHLFCLLVIAGCLFVDLLRKLLGS